MYQASSIKYQGGVVGLVFLSVLLLSSGGAGAQSASPFLSLTWSTGTLVPDDFRGKALPTLNSKISASLEVIAAGKAVDISEQNVSWYLNGGLAQSGRGLKRMDFAAPATAGGEIELRAELPDYPGNALVKTIDVPVVWPEAVIEAPFPGNAFSQNQIALVARAYFFNVSSFSALGAGWRVNDQAPDNMEKPEELNIGVLPDTPRGFPVRITLSLSNPSNPAEVASEVLTLLFNP